MQLEMLAGDGVEDDGAAAAAPAAGALPEATGPLPPLPPLPPLAVDGVVVGKAGLVAALRAYVPQLADIGAMDGGSFLLSFAPLGPLGTLDSGDPLDPPAEAPAASPAVPP